ncbi:MAG: MmcQ/YjbR family DNA-binding protein [Bacteroidetes bacterium]|nr:MmcQ/YjbR family DNA-binding protein [Bacteroidota bacterium]
MNIEDLYSLCASKPYVNEDFPFDDQTLVFKIGGKIFLLVDINNPISISVKCSPERSIELRERFEGIQPGYHMNKKHWITISLRAEIPQEILVECINNSYELVIKSLTKKMQTCFNVENL